MLELFDATRLTPAQRRIAHCLLESGARAAHLSSIEVAELAGVSQPSVTRFAMALGFDGYPALRKVIRNFVDEPAADPNAGVWNELQRAVHREVTHLRRLAERLADRTAERDVLAAAGKLLMDSTPLPVVGLRAASGLATYFAFFAAKVHPDVRVLDHGGSVLTDRLEQARAAGATAMLGIVLPRYPKESLDALRAARALGLSTVVLTDSLLCPAADLGDHALAAPVGGQLVFDLHSAPMALAMVLLQAMCDAAPNTTQVRLEQFEASAARRGVFTD
jgi:DNA-binding MurR/RpiR family transcriptional regulator